MVMVLMDVDLLLLLGWHLLHRGRSVDDLWLRLRLFHPRFHTLFDPHRRRLLLRRNVNLLHDLLGQANLLWRRGLLLGWWLRATRTNDRLLRNLLRRITNRQHFLRRRRLRNQLPLLRLLLLLLLNHRRWRSWHNSSWRRLQLDRRLLLWHWHGFRWLLRLNLLRGLLSHNNPLHRSRLPLHDHHP